MLNDEDDRLSTLAIVVWEVVSATFVAISAWGFLMLVVLR